MYRLLLYFLVIGTEGSVKLHDDGIIPQAGTVEYCVNGAWKGVCDSNWDYKDAFVVCRQLGFPATGKPSHMITCSSVGLHSCYFCCQLHGYESKHNYSIVLND